jgi:hypothetical protein
MVLVFLVFVGKIFGGFRSQSNSTHFSYSWRKAACDFSLRGQRKVTKRKATLSFVPSGFPALLIVCGGAPMGLLPQRRTRGVHAAPLRALTAKDSGAHSAHPCASPFGQPSAVRFGFPAKSSAQQKGLGKPQIPGMGLFPSLRCSRASQSSLGEANPCSSEASLGERQ